MNKGFKTEKDANDFKNKIGKGLVVELNGQLAEILSIQPVQKFSKMDKNFNPTGESKWDFMILVDTTGKSGKKSTAHWPGSAIKLH